VTVPHLDGTWFVVCPLAAALIFQLYVNGSAASPGGLLSANFTYVQAQFDLPINHGLDKQPADLTGSEPQPSDPRLLARACSAD
jgi:hypothetical protein